MKTLQELDAASLAVCTGAKQSDAIQYLPYIKEYCLEYGIDTAPRLAGFLAQVGHESANLTRLEENLNYSCESLANTWPHRYAAKSEDGGYIKVNNKYTPNELAILLNRNPQLIANNCYANRMGNGDEASGEGWKFRGRGLKQLTGKTNYAALTLDTGIDFISQPSLLLSCNYAVLSACWFWKTNNLNKFADRLDIEGMTRAINGGLLGLKMREILFKKALSILK